jgi:hypothetical protein
MARAIVRLVLDPHLKRRLADGARRTAERLSWDAELDRLDASYRDVVAAAGRAARTTRSPEPIGVTAATG